MEEEQTITAGGCPPHHWVIANTATDQGLVERWACQRCDATRERVISRRRPLRHAPKQYVGETGDAPIEYAAQAGERVA
jgi:hypothetical protein